MLNSVRIVSTYRIFSVTIDEPYHIARGMEWLDRGTYNYGGEHPPLAEITAALGPFLTGIRLSPEQNGILDKFRRPGIWDYKEAIKWDAMLASGIEILTHGCLPKKNPLECHLMILALARSGMLVFFLLAAGIVWFWTRSLFGLTTAFMATLIFTSLPTILAHAGLATTDMAFTALFLTSMLTFTMWLEASSMWKSLLLGVVWALTVLAKFSALIFLPACAATIVLLRWFFIRFTRLRITGGEASDSNRVGRLISLGIATCVIFLVVWAGYRFSVGPFAYAENRPHKSIDEIFGSEGRLHELSYVVAEAPILMPELLEGIENVRIHNRDGHRGYLMGEIRERGWWYFFPMVVAIKTPIGFLILVLVGCIVLVRRGVSDYQWRPLVPLLCAVIVLFICMSANINIGVRHILPIYPLLSIVAAYAVSSLWSLRQMQILGRVAAVSLLGWHLTASALSHPDYLAYFNELAQSNPERFVVDSDLDWGQDLLRLRKELQARGITSVGVSIFGDTPLGILGLSHARRLAPHQRTTGWVAISIQNIKNDPLQTEPPYHGYAWLEAYKPVMIVGKSIRLYHIPEEGRISN